MNAQNVSKPEHIDVQSAANGPHGGMNVRIDDFDPHIGL